jgi:murein DD-endopeptidase MepM/ murein hydrolase activator NlpD
MSTTPKPTAAARPTDADAGTTRVNAGPLQTVLVAIAVSVLYWGVGINETPATASAVATATTAGSVATTAASTAATTAASTAATTPSSTHPYSDPVWSPLRTATRISCVKSNCTGSGADYHGYWAIDFVGRLGDPVYAAGAGVAHVGANSRSCSTTGSQGAGVWVWVDHGGGVVSKYTHLDSLAVVEGQLVTPATRLGAMGHWGDVAPCTTNYLHFEVREGGVTGLRVEPKLLKACTTTATVSMPAAFGVTSFDSLTSGRSSTPSAHSGCITPVWNATPARPTVTVARRSSAAALAWGTPPSGVTSVRVATQLWSPSVGMWNAPTYRTFTGAPTGGTITGLTNGRTYRMSVVFRNASGFSAWSSSKYVIPATVPSAPKAPRFLTSPTVSYVHFGWWKSLDNGSAVTSYQSQVRCYRDGRYLAWSYQNVNAATYYYNHQGLSAYSLCQVRVKAVNSMGSSAWSVTSTIRKATA